MARQDLHFRLRIPEHLKGRIESAAAENERSMTAEIVARLEWTFGPADDAILELRRRSAEKGERLNELHRTVSDLSHSLRTREQEVDALKIGAETVQRENQQLREKLAYQEGMSASLRHGMQVFIEHLVRANEGKPVSLDEIMAEAAAPPPKGRE